jgi:hypothetical protein
MLAGAATLLEVGTRAGRTLDVDEIPLRRTRLRGYGPAPADPPDLRDSGQLATALLSCVNHVTTVYTVVVLVKRLDAYISRMHSRRMATRIKRRKATRKEEMVPIRMTADQKATLAAAAERRGLPLSTWLLMLGLREADAGN